MSGPNVPKPGNLLDPPYGILYSSSFLGFQAPLIPNHSNARVTSHSNPLTHMLCQLPHPGSSNQFVRFGPVMTVSCVRGSQSSASSDATLPLKLLDMPQLNPHFATPTLLHVKPSHMIFNSSPGILQILHLPGMQFTLNPPD
eukprot:Blabericola_migrator_1__5503@NODE_2808_length_2330_cov_18_816173_g1640_i2_p1_GENE_NODE_2808_length_2330_cov_18_816173_g1640_i2NODE_2808_length_2330_cov_18_816173_g1640_i2_p1_ORF_typecomplete_len142_score9_33_NODE_2808_length_2330_cov_18_816173_g1640_i217732198